MPRGPRVDWPGACHHIIVRGVERRIIFVDEIDRNDLLRRLNRVLPEAGARCFGWVFMSNHVHLALRIGPFSLASIMRRVGTGYAMHFNRRHDRVGHLFQNRYLSRVVQSDADLMGVVRYIHLNPVRAGIVRSPIELDRYPWCGHGALMGTRRPEEFHSIAETLSLFEEHEDASRRTLAEWMRETNPSDPTRARAAPGPTDAGLREFAALRDRMCLENGVNAAELRAGSKAAPVSRLRRLLAHEAVVRLGLAGGAVAPELGTSPTSIARAVRRVRADRRGSSLKDRPQVPEVPG